MATSSALPRVLIMGGGVSGLALAHGLKRNKIPFHVFERDASADTRSQGYRVRIAGEALDSLKYLLTPETMNTFDMSCGEYIQSDVIPQINATTAEVDYAALGDRPNPHKRDGRTVDRTVFRHVLLQGLDESKGEIQFGKAFERYETDAKSGQVTAFFKDGSSATGSLLVGADGRGSNVRGQFFPAQRQHDTGGRAIYGKTEITEELRKTVLPEAFSGMTAMKDFSQEDALSVIMEPIVFKNREEAEKRGIALPKDYFFWCIASQPARLGFSSDLTKTPRLSVKEAEDLAHRVTAAWHPSLRPIFANQKEDYSCMLSIKSVESDFLFRTEDAPKNVTMLGDACHAMSPAGSGALTALRDAYHLCRLIVDEGVSPATVEKFERQMKEYASKAVEMSWFGAKAIFGVKGEQKNVSEVMKELNERRAAST